MWYGLYTNKIMNQLQSRLRKFENSWQRKEKKMDWWPNIRDLNVISTTVRATNIAQAGLSRGYSASGPSKAVMGVARHWDLAVSRPDGGPTGRIRENDAIQNERRSRTWNDHSAADASRVPAGPRPDSTAWTQWLSRARPRQATQPRLKQDGADEPVTQWLGPWRRIGRPSGLTWTVRRSVLTSV